MIPDVARRTRTYFLTAIALCCLHANAQLAPQRLYYGHGQRVMLEVTAPDDAVGDTLRMRLHDPATAEILAETSCASGPVDLAGLFPRLWASDAPRVINAQLYAGSEPIGPPLVVQPLLTPDTAVVIDPGTLMPTTADTGVPVFESTARRLQAVRAGLPPTQREVTFSGLRIYPERQVVMHTSLGALTLRLRPDAAPNTAFWIAHLVDGGLYTDIQFHRIVDRLGDGSRFVVQAGDPTATGLGGPGFAIDLEPSTLEHDYGVVSLARPPGDPNAGGSQFFICLGRAGTAALDGHYTPFAELIDGVETLERIAAAPVDEQDRPLTPITIEHAELIDAPPIPARPQRVTDPRSAPAAQADDR